MPRGNVSYSILIYQELHHFNKSTTMPSMTCLSLNLCSKISYFWTLLESIKGKNKVHGLKIGYFRQICDLQTISWWRTFESGYLKFLQVTYGQDKLSLVNLSYATFKCQLDLEPSHMVYICRYESYGNAHTKFQVTLSSDEIK